MGVDGPPEPWNDTRRAGDGVQDERLQEYAESVASDTEPKDPRTRQEHANDIPQPDEPPPRSPDSADQRDSADQASPRDQDEAPQPAEGDSSETEESFQPGNPRADSDDSPAAPEGTDAQEALPGEVETMSDTITENENSSVDEDPSEPARESEASKPHDDIPVADDQPSPLTDKEWAEHVVEVRDGLDKARQDGLESHLMYTIDPDHQSWSKDRRELHSSIINDLYAAAHDVPNQGCAIIAGGLGGAGKTTVLTEDAGIDMSQYLVINPDDMKEEMARRDMIPEISGLSPMEASDLVHEESSYLARQLALRAHADKKNLIWDITMSSKESVAKRVNELSAAEYTRIEGLFVDIPIETSIRRTDSRHREGYDRYKAGDGLGGRYVPPEVIKHQEDSEWGSENKKVFNTMKQRFNDWSVYDNSVDGRRAVLVESNRSRHAS